MIRLSDFARCRRGRPRGSTRDDDELLLRLARYMLAHPGARPFTVIKKLMTPKDHRCAEPASGARRLHRKWQKRARFYLAQAKAQRQFEAVQRATRMASNIYVAQEAIRLSAIQAATSEMLSVTRRIDHQQPVIDLARRNAAQEAERMLGVSKSAIETQRIADEVSRAKTAAYGFDPDTATGRMRLQMERDLARYRATTSLAAEVGALADFGPQFRA